MTKADCKPVSNWYDLAAGKSNTTSRTTKKQSIPFVDHTSCWQHSTPRSRKPAIHLSSPGLSTSLFTMPACRNTINHLRIIILMARHDTTIWLLARVLGLIHFLIACRKLESAYITEGPTQVGTQPLAQRTCRGRGWQSQMRATG